MYRLARFFKVLVDALIEQWDVGNHQFLRHSTAALHQAFC
jgi:hypothetical protein